MLAHPPIRKPMRLDAWDKLKPNTWGTWHQTAIDHTSAIDLKSMLIGNLRLSLNDGSEKYYLFRGICSPLVPSSAAPSRRGICSQIVQKTNVSGPVHTHLRNQYATT